MDRKADRLQFCLTVDVEADHLWRSNPGDSVSCSNIQALDDFCRLASEAGFPPTLLVSYEVLEDVAALQYLKKILTSYRCEVGAHLHPWLTPPRSEDDDKFKCYPSDLGDEPLRAKLQVLTQAIKDKLGVTPKSYRAGRWGFNQVNARVLAEMGYQVDCSVTPYLSWKDNGGGKFPGADYRRYDPTPFWIKEAEGLMEIPVTICFLWDGLLPIWKSLLPLITEKGLCRRVLKFFGARPLWLRPLTTNQMPVYRRVIARAKHRKWPLIEMMLHSSELLPTANDRFNTDITQAAMRRDFQALFRYLNERGVEGVTLQEAFASLAKQRLPVKKLIVA